MKIDRQKAKCGDSRPSVDVQNLIRELLLSASLSYDALAQRLSSIKVWKYSKSEFCDWYDVVDVFDEILADATAPAIHSAAAVGVNVGAPSNATVEQPALAYSGPHLYMRIDEPQHERSLRKVVHEILHFYSLLVEHTFSRSSFSSIGRLFQLLFSDNLHVVYNVLVLLHTFARRSNLFERLQDKRTRDINAVLHLLAMPWDTNASGVAADFTLAVCCSKRPLPQSSTAVVFQGSATKPQQQLSSDEQQLSAPVVISGSTSRQFGIDSNICYSETNLPTAHIMQTLLSAVNVSLEEVDEKQQHELFEQIRRAKHFCTHEMRIMNVQVRLQALTVLLLNSALTLPKRFLYNGFLEELVDILKLDGEGSDLADIKTCVLRTLTAIVHYYNADSESLSSVLQAAGLALPYGTVPSIVREFVDYLTEPNNTTNNESGGGVDSAVVKNKAAAARRFPIQYTTALFSFLYHISSLSIGAEALTNADIMQMMLRVINLYFIDTTAVVTPAIIIVNATNGIQADDSSTSTSSGAADAAAPSSSSSSSSSFLNTILLVSNEESLAIATRAVRVVDLLANNNLQLFRKADGFACMTARLVHEVKCCLREDAAYLKTAAAALTVLQQQQQQQTVTSSAALTCHPQRAAFMKSALSFLKKAISDDAFNGTASSHDVFGDDTRNALKCIIEQSDFFGLSLLVLSLDVITSYISKDTATLADCQASGLSQAILNAVFVKSLPATRELISLLPQTCTSLCFNSRGVEQFRAVAPFDRICRILLSVEYIPALRRQKNDNNNNNVGLRQRELTQQLGGTVEQLVQNHPVLRADAGKAVVSMLNKLVAMGNAVSMAGAPNITMPGSNVIGDINNHSNTVQPKSSPIDLSSVPAVIYSSTHRLISPSASASETNDMLKLLPGVNAGNSASFSVAGSTVDLNIAHQQSRVSRQPVDTLNGAAMLSDDPGLGLRQSDSVHSVGGKTADLIDFDREDDSELTFASTSSPMAASVGGLAYSTSTAVTVSSDGIGGVGSVVDAEKLVFSASTVHAEAAKLSTSKADAAVAAPAMNGHAGNNIDTTMADAAVYDRRQQSTINILPGIVAENAMSFAFPYHHQLYHETTCSVVLQSSLTEMLLNVAFFTDSFLSNTDIRLESLNVSDFAASNGLKDVIGLLKLENVALDFAMSSACSALGKLVRTIYSGWNRLELPNSRNNTSNKVLDDIISSLQTLTSEALVSIRHNISAGSPANDSVSSGRSALVDELAAARAFSLASLSNIGSGKPKLDGFAASSISQQTCCPLTQKLSHIHTHVYVLSMLCKSNTRQVSSSSANSNVSDVLVQSVSVPQLAAQLVTLYNMLARESNVLMSQSDSTQSLSIAAAAVIPFPPNLSLLDDATSMRFASQLLSVPATNDDAAAADTCSSDADNNIKRIARATTDGDVAKLIQPTLTIITKLSCALNDLLLQVIRMPYFRKQRHRRSRLGAIKQSHINARVDDRMPYSRSSVFPKK